MNIFFLYVNGFIVDDKYLIIFFWFLSKRCYCYFIECFYFFEKDWLDELILIYIMIINESEFYGVKMFNRSSEEIINK